MSEKIYTYEDVHSWAEKAIMEKGADYVYIPLGEGTSCKYVHDDGVNLTTGCLIGNMLFNNTGMILSELSEFNTGPDTSILGIRHDLPFKFTEMAIHWMDVLQGKQDNGYPWGEALALVDRGFGKEMFDRDEDLIPSFRDSVAF